MDITFVDTENHRKWTYTDVISVDIIGKQLRVMGWDGLEREPYRIKENLSDFEYIEMRKE